MKKIIILGLICLFLSSCQRIFYGGSFSPDYNLLSHPSQYKIIDKAEGSATATYFIGIGGFKHEKLLNDAKADLITNAHLKVGQYLLETQNGNIIMRVNPAITSSPCRPSNCTLTGQQHY